jgi:hypothetical protein
MSINGTVVQTTNGLNAESAGLKPGDMATLAVTHMDGSQTHLKLTVGVLPGD